MRGCTGRTDVNWYLPFLQRLFLWKIVNIIGLTSKRTQKTDHMSISSLKRSILKQRYFSSSFIILCCQQFACYGWWKYSLQVKIEKFDTIFHASPTYKNWTKSVAIWHDDSKCFKGILSLNSIFLKKTMFIKNFRSLDYNGMSRLTQEKEDNIYICVRNLIILVSVSHLSSFANKASEYSFLIDTFKKKTWRIIAPNAFFR